MYHQPVYENLSVRENLKARSLLLGVDERGMMRYLKSSLLQIGEKEGETVNICIEEKSGEFTFVVEDTGGASVFCQKLKKDEK